MELGILDRKSIPSKDNTQNKNDIISDSCSGLIK